MAAANADDVPARLGFDTRDERLVCHEVFESIYNPGKLLLLTSWREAEAGSAWAPKPQAAGPSLRHRRVRVIRDYGMFERREAPQFYREVGRASRLAKRVGES